MDHPSFGQWLQRRRKALGLTQAELGGQAGCSAAAIRKIEADERRPSRDVAEQLAHVLGIPADEQPQFLRFARGESSSGPRTDQADESQPWRPTARPVSNLPIPPTPPVGRTEEISTIAALLARLTVRLVTLTGPGGIGKTRLGIAAAGQVRDTYPDDVYFVPLAAISDPDLVLPTIAQLLGVQEAGGRPLTDLVAAQLRDKRLLLVLDNFEHLLSAATVVSHLLDAAPQLQILATSREPLHLAAEQQFPVPPLALPDWAKVQDRDTLAQNDAVALFVQRARTVKPDFLVTNRTAPAIAEICTRLDGLPLAIELAAARSKVLAPDALLQRLGSRLSMLSGGPRDVAERQQTLRNTIDWSYSLLSAAEQRLFAWLAVFVGGWTLDALEAIWNDDELAVLDGLQSLVDKSLVQQGVSSTDELRFTMLETIREYAGENLAAIGHLEEARRRHASHYAALGEQAELELVGANQVMWLERLAAEHDNLRQALQWLLDHGQVERAARLAVALRRYWWIRGYLVEGQRLLEDILEQGDEVSMPLRIQLLTGVGILGRSQGDFERARVALEAGMTLRRELGDLVSLAAGLDELGQLEIEQGHYGDAEQLLEESLTLYRQADDTYGLANVLNNLGYLMRLQQNYARAKLLFEEALALDRARGDRQMVIEITNLAIVARAQGDHDRAMTLFREGLTLSQEMGMVLMVAANLLGIAAVLVARGQPRGAVELYAATETVIESTGSALVIDADELEARDHGLSVARQQLGETSFRTAWDTGRAMSPEQAVAHALGEI